MALIHLARQQVMEQKQYQKSSNFYDILEEDEESAQSSSKEEVLSEDDEYSYTYNTPLIDKDKGSRNQHLQNKIKELEEKLANLECGNAEMALYIINLEDQHQNTKQPMTSCKEIVEMEKLILCL